jgi:Na+-transporting NADH:ubiquinone oxidoreductase subunit E
MENLVSIAVRSIFVDNMIFAYFLGMCSYLAVSKKVSTAFGLRSCSNLCIRSNHSYQLVIQNYILVEGALAWVSPEFAKVDLTFLQFIIFIAVIAAMVQLTEMAVEKFSPALYGSLGIFLPLIAVNCAILGGSLFMVGRPYNLAEATVYGFGSGIGWMLADCCFGRCARKNEILKCTWSVKRIRNYIYFSRTDVARLSEFPRILYLKVDKMIIEEASELNGSLFTFTDMKNTLAP